jgi:hypothetical protein
VGRSGSEAAPCSGAAVRHDALRPIRVGGRVSRLPIGSERWLASLPQEPAFVTQAHHQDRRRSSHVVQKRTHELLQPTFVNIHRAPPCLVDLFMMSQSAPGVNPVAER